MSKIKVREYTENDKKQVLDLCAEVFGADKVEETERLLEWETIKRPFSHPGSIMYVLENEGQIIGNVWCFPMPFDTDRGVVYAYHFSSFMVSPRFRFHGLHLMKKIAALPHFVYITNPTESARKVYKGMGFSSWAYCSFSRTVSWKRKIILENKKLGSGYIVKIIAKALDNVLHMTKNKNLLKESKRFTCKETKCVDDSFKTFYEEFKKGFPNGIAQRLPEILQWRFFENPKNEFRLVVLHDSHNKVQGYAFFRIAPHGDLQACLVRDWAVEGENKEMKALFGHIMRIARQEGADFVFVDNAPPKYRGYFRAWSFTENESGLFFYKNQNPDISESFMKSQEGVFFSGMEGDNF